LYLYFSPKVDASDLKGFFTSEDAVLSRNLQKTNRFLANLVRLLAEAYKKMKRKRDS
jgi:hypothetical protein